MKKCDCDVVKIGGYDLDPCVYEEIETVENAKVHILKCKVCGHVEIEWERKDE